MSTVVVVDDEPQIIRALRVNLVARGHEVVTAMTGRQALDAVAHSHPDVVVLDLGLPDMDGLEVIDGLRGWTEVPILVLTGRHETVTKVAALDRGADDYVSKPFHIDELLARMRAVSRRAGTGPGSPDDVVVVVGDVTVDLEARTVTRHAADDIAASVRLTPTEWAVLELLVRNPGRLLTQRQLATAVRGPHAGDDGHYLRQFMAQLRRKLEADPSRPRHLLTEPGMGYRFQP